MVPDSSRLGRAFRKHSCFSMLSGSLIERGLGSPVERDTTVRKRFKTKKFIKSSFDLSIHLHGRLWEEE